MKQQLQYGVYSNSKGASHFDRNKRKSELEAMSQALQQISQVGFSMAQAIQGMTLAIQGWSFPSPGTTENYRQRSKAWKVYSRQPADALTYPWPPLPGSDPEFEEWYTAYQSVSMNATTMML